MDEKLKSKSYFIIILILAIISTAILTYYLVPREEVGPKPEYIFYVDAGNYYECDIGEFIKFKGVAYGGNQPYNWSWDFNGDGYPDSYDREGIYFYDNLKPSLEYANLTVTDKLNNVNSSTAFVYIDVDLEIGDIVFFKVKQKWQDLYEFFFGEEMPYAVHAAMYIGNNLFIESADYSFAKSTVIEKDLINWYNKFNEINLSIKGHDDQITPPRYLFNLENGVQKSHSFKLNYIHDQTGLGKVSIANFSQRIMVRDFCEKQLGKPYQWVLNSKSMRANPNITDPNNNYNIWTIFDDPYIDFWYCTELIWAGYLHQQINIDGDVENNPQNNIETVFYNECREYFGSELIDISRLPEWTRWQII